MIFLSNDKKLLSCYPEYCQGKGFSSELNIKYRPSSVKHELERLFLKTEECFAYNSISMAVF